ncbi:hypothetical protein YTPLAS72_19690 [Nitrospira sp.]|nr:hypothetical protein YTPLAS72_19690 [Nitrospira sp.]
MKVISLLHYRRIAQSRVLGRFLSYTLIVAMTLCGAIPALAEGLVEIAELLAHPEQYDHLDVMVTGKVMNVQLATNRQGQPAYGFLLQDPAGTLKVVSLGQVAVHEGDQVIVEGVFSRLRQVGRKIVYNEIKAISVKPLTRLNPDLVG